MIYLPVSLLLFLIFLLLLPFLWFVITLDVLEVAVAKLGFTPKIALILLLAVIVGSLINIPLYTVESKVAVVSDYMELWLRQFWGIPLRTIQQKTVVALNIGGGLIPVLLAIYELTRSNILGIVSVSAIVIAPSQAPSVAFAGGILGTLIGADVLHLKEIERMSPGVLSIGGAGVFDGIALCGLFALLLT